MKWLNNTGQEPNLDPNTLVEIMFNYGGTIKEKIKFLNWELSDAQYAINSWRLPSKVPEKKFSMEEMSLMLPDGFYWGDSLTPEILQQILSKEEKPSTKDFFS